MLGVFAIVRDPGTTTEGFFCFFKDGRFVELCDYHSGAQQGGIRVPEGRNGASWACFVMELRRFFLGDIDAVVVDSSEKTIRNPLHNVRNSKSLDFRRQRVIKEDITQRPNKELLKLITCAVMSKVEPRPTRRFVFKWNPHPNTLVITKR